MTGVSIDPARCSLRVISVVGRFLEHSRVYYFRNGGDEEYYIGSADLMLDGGRKFECVAYLVPDASVTAQLAGYALSRNPGATGASSEDFFTP